MAKAARRGNGRVASASACRRTMHRLAAAQLLDREPGRRRRRVDLHFREFMVLHGRGREIRVRTLIALDPTQNSPVLPIHAGEPRMLDQHVASIARIEGCPALYRKPGTAVAAVLAPE